jgi:hypothetical protein
MNIAKALKVKNRLVGRIANQQLIITRENCRRDDNVSMVNVEAEFEVLQNLVNELVNLKTQISVASTPIFGKIVQMQEQKAFVNYLRSISTREGVEIESYGQTVVKEYKWTSFINDVKKDILIKELEDSINALQDEVDNFNAITSI